uniref:Uncharacterized protein n=1 Tax=Glossina austeni TaxID=7395 RepID=A0A1A9VFC1_GLOAU
MGHQLFHNVVPLLEELSGERHVIQITANGGQETRRQQFSNGGESAQSMINKGVELMRHKEILKGTEEFFNGSKEFRGEKLVVAGPVFEDVFNGSLDFVGEELSELSVPLVEDVLEEFVEAAEVFSEIIGFVFLEGSVVVGGGSVVMSTMLYIFTIVGSNHLTNDKR